MLRMTGRGSVILSQRSDSEAPAKNLFASLFVTFSGSPRKKAPVHFLAPKPPSPVFSSADEEKTPRQETGRFVCAGGYSSLNSS